MALGLLLGTLILGTSGAFTDDSYVIVTETASLPSALSTERSSGDRNVLEDLENRRIDKSAFDSAASIKVLSPADNFLGVSPRSVLPNLKNLDLSSQTGNGTAENSTSTNAHVYDYEFPEVTDNPADSSTIGNFNRSGECLEKMYRKLDRPCPIGDGTVENFVRNYADVCNLESLDVTDDPAESLTAGTFDQPSESVDSAIPETADDLPIYYNPPTGRADGECCKVTLVSKRFIALVS